jgi:3-deoxy-D-manno-octulosonic-acid transferase
VELARRLQQELERRAPGLPLLVTATTATGLALARRTLGQRLPVHACPLDLPGPVSRVLTAARPRMVVLVETELWPELIHQAASRAIPVLVVNGRLSADAMPRYLKVRRLLGPLLEPLTRVLARSDEDAHSFIRIGVPESRVRVVGNIKYDLEQDLEPLAWEDRLVRWAGQRPVLVAGSTMEGEERAVLEAVAGLVGSGRVFLILAPRHPERFDSIARLLEDQGLAMARRSRLDQAPAEVDVLLLDTIGELARAYRVATTAFIGGSLVPSGGHNPLEAAVWGVPVLTGPHVRNFQEVFDQLVVAGGARMVDGGDELGQALAAWLGDVAAARSAGRAGRQVVEANRGALARTADQILELAGLGHGEPG